MQVGILNAGHLPSDIETSVGSYSEMIRAAFGSAYTYRDFDVESGDFPRPDTEADAYILTGSASSVYDKHPWIDHLRVWLRKLNPSTPLVGICFGHQIMAEAFGGVVERSNKGMAVGIHEYKVSSHETWMDDASSFAIPVMHYDQVTKPPPASRLFATNDFCHYAALTYWDRRALSFQGHPEFALPFVAMAIDRCQQKGMIGVAQAEQARASMLRSDDRTRVLKWIHRFLE